MNYAKIYHNLTSMPNTNPGTYTEKHHIIPKCMGGSDDDNNLVSLTPEAHFVAHQLLVKMYPEHKGLKYALYMMTIGPNGCRLNNKLFGWIKRDYMTNRPKSKGMLGKKHSKESIELMKTKRALQVFTEETCMKISLAKSGVKFSDSAKASFNEKRKNNQAWIDSNFRPCKESTKTKISKANLGRVFEKRTCPHCNKIGAGPNMKRYHFDNCKLKTSELHLPAL